MKRLLSLLVACCCLTPALQAGTATEKDRVVYPFRFAPSEGLVNRTEKPWRADLCINGYWDFQPVPLPEGFRVGRDAAPVLPKPSPGLWSETPLKIPSPWNVNGFSWRNLEGPDHRDYPSYPASWNDVKMGWMRKVVTIPADWEGRVIRLYFEAVAGYAEVYVNGQPVCENFDLFLPFEADITDVVRPGDKAEILVGVRSQALFEDHSTVGRRIVPAGSMWGSWINGIWQDVYLEALPQVRVDDVYVKPLVSEGVLEMDVTLSNATARKADVRLGGEVDEWLNLAGNDVNTAPVARWELGKTALTLSPRKLSIPAGGSLTTTIRIPVPEGALRYWTPESPNLYALLLKVGTAREMLDVKYERFGWREWTLEGTRQLLNGQPYELRGDSWHFMGIPQMTRRYAWAWFSAIKGMNGNAVRPHAQVYPRFYLDVADELGICVLDETANWGSDGGPKFDAPAFWEHSKDHLRRFIHRDRNHASVFGWSVSNENKPVILNVFNRPDLMPLQEEAWAQWRDIVRAADTTRPWISSDGEDDGNGILPVTVGHYGDASSMKHWIGIGKPWGIGEHGMAYYGTPEQVSKYNGERAYESQLGRMEGLAHEAYQLISAQRANGASYTTVFNMVWYALKPLPLGHHDVTRVPDVERDGIFFGPFEEGVPGVQPERLGPYGTTFNPGYDPSLPLFDPWPMYEALRAVNAPGGPAWSPFAEVDKTRYAPLPAQLAEPYAEVLFIGEESSQLKALMDMQGVHFSTKLTQPTHALYLVDGSRIPDASVLAALKKGQEKGADLWIWGLRPETVEGFAPVLPHSLTLDTLPRASFLPRQLSWTRGLGNSDFYFCELQRTPANRFTLKGPFVDEGTVLLEACRTDWNTWNKRPEDAKTAAVIRSEYETVAATPVLVRCSAGLSDVYVSTLTDFAQSEKGYRTLSALLRNAGIPCTKRTVNAAEVFFLRDGELHFPSDARRRLVGEGDGKVRLDLYVYSPRPLDDLLIEPDMPKLTLMAKPSGAALSVNGKDIPAAVVDRYESLFRELPLQQGWNHLTLVLDGRARQELDCRFRCDNQRSFLGQLAAKLVSPEGSAD